MAARSTFSDNFLRLFCEKNSDGTQNLRLKGNELAQRIGKRIKAENVERICDFLNKDHTINNLNLCYNEIGDEGLAILCDKVLKVENSIQYLNIAHCDITGEGMRSFYKTVPALRSKLKKLRLYGNPIGPEGGYATALLCHNCPYLEYLDLGETHQTVDSIDSLFYELHKLSSIKILNISRIIPYSCSHFDTVFLAVSISEFLRINPYIVELHLQKCKISGHDAELLIEGLTKNSSLLYFDIAYNNLCDFGVELIANWLGTRPKLLGLNVAGNRMGNASAVALSLKLPFSRLRLLDISDNHITDYGIKSILNSIKKPYMLRYLYLWGNTCGSKVNKIIQRMVRSGVFEQENIDVKIYCVDGEYQAARNPVDLFKHRYYDVRDYGYAGPLRIVKNRVEKAEESPRALVKFEHVDRFPPLPLAKANRVAFS